MSEEQGTMGSEEAGQASSSEGVNVFAQALEILKAEGMDEQEATNKLNSISPADGQGEAFDLETVLARVRAMNGTPE